MRYAGVDYYPEQWGLEHLDEDLDNIVELGCNAIRIADFAWDILEPEDGRYDFTFFDEVIARAEEKGLKVVFCIPTATMPVWLYEKHPDIMNEDETGYRQPFGARRGYCYNSEVYFEKARMLTEAIAEHYRNCATIVAYQTDNEIGHEGSDMCFCASCQNRFHAFLERRYGNIDKLNREWGTHFWGHTYQRFDQIPLPRKAFTAHNPSLRMEWERFRSESIENFLKMMYETIKENDPEKTVIHDFSGGLWNKHFDAFRAAEYMDIVAYNNYPVWGGQPKAMEDYEVAFSLDTVRGLKKKNFWVTEAIMGAQGHDVIGKAPQPLEAVKWSALSLRFGAESLFYFRYRGYIKGAEQFCFGIVDADNLKRRKYYEAKAFFSASRKRMPPERKADTCLVYDYASAASFRIQRQSDTMDYENEARKLYQQFYKRKRWVDIVDKHVDLKQYRYILIPAMIVMDDSFRIRLKEAVSSGSRVVMTFRTGWKDEYNNLTFGRRLPVGLSDLVGAVLEEHEALLTGQNKECVMNEARGYGEVFMECMKQTTAVGIVDYVRSGFGDYSAVLENQYGEGKCYYLATSLNEEMLSLVFDRILEGQESV